MALLQKNDQLGIALGHMTIWQKQNKTKQKGLLPVLWPCEIEC